MSDGPRLPRLFGAGQWAGLQTEALRRKCGVCGAGAGVRCKRARTVDGVIDFVGERPTPHRSRMLP